LSWDASPERQSIAVGRVPDAISICRPGNVGPPVAALGEVDRASRSGFLPDHLDLGRRVDTDLDHAPDIHHRNKPPSSKQVTELSGSDLAYLGAGSAELVNFARATMSLQSTGTYDLFRLVHQPIRELAEAMHVLAIEMVFDRRPRWSSDLFTDHREPDRELQPNSGISHRCGLHRVPLRHSPSSLNLA
jgi:hypothetical protein